MKQRPLSPHLQIYRPQISSVLSIMHRFTGIGLFFGLFLLVIGLGCLATGESTFQEYRHMMSGVFGQLILFLCLMAFYYHLANGIRHLGWDIGYGFEIKSMERSGVFVVIFTLAATICTWMNF